MNKKLDWSRDNILAYQVEFKGIISEVEEKLAEFGTVRIFARIPELVGAELSAMGDRLRF
ncbi:hypothetical protein CR205_03010 [Alteribacter lacisalsi]|uniref:Uncharacterized protein n=1 Tax=Alteribacter lacisalsi TaxID=2045244 RepID=A0A2W0HL39_9BACI|nr:hypothetical protein [Alteribacter lacisalsi]PYZ97579.1 hypothetical protein CR205_03010 [Alteribacter lacisalsi]